MDPVTGANALTLLGKAVDVIGKLKESHDDASVDENTIKLHGLIISLQSEILRIQSEYANLLQVKNDLEQQLSDKSRWGDIEANYELKQIARGTFLYEFKIALNPGKPRHYICPKCYEDGKKSVIQVFNHDEFGVQFRCNRCEGAWDISTQDMLPDTLPFR